MNAAERARTRSPRGKGEVLGDEILDAAESLLIETQSEDAVSIRAVADRVGVTPPSIYRHFEDKATLMFQVCGRQFDRLDQELRAVREAEADPVDALLACGRAYVRFGLEHPEAYRIMFMGHSDLTPDQYRGEVMAGHGTFAGLVGAVEAVGDAGRLAVDDVMEATLVLWIAVHGLVSLRITKPSFPWPPLEEQIDTQLEVLRRSLFREPA